VSLSSAEREALDRLVPRERQTGDLIADLTAAAQEAWRRREQNTQDGGAVLAALYRDTRSWRTLAYITKIPATTARRWSIPPGEADAETPVDTPPQD
jgi:hypothetical protein